MKSKILPLLIILFSSITCITFGQAPGMIWQRCYGTQDYQAATAVTATRDGGFVTVNAGYPVANAQCTSQSTVTKFTAAGVLEWEACMPDKGSVDVTSIVQLADDGYAFVFAAHNYDKPTLVRLDKTGNILFTKTYGGTRLDYLNYLQLTKDGNLICAGIASSTDGDLTGINSTTSNKGWLVKMDLNGQIIWQKCIGDDVSRFYSFNSVAETKDGGFVISGSGRYQSPPWGLVGDAIAIKTDNNGNVLWERHYGGSGPDGGVRIIEISDGSYVLLGNLQSNDAGISQYHGSLDGMLVKISPIGDIIWTRAIGGSSFENFYSLMENSNKEIVLAGGTYSKNGDMPANNLATATHLCIVNVDEFYGDINWLRVYGGIDPVASFDQAQAVCQLKNGTYIAAGGTDSHDGDVYGNHGDRDIWLVNMGPYNTVTGNVFIDLNSNGQQDVGEGYLNIATVNAGKAASPVRTWLPSQSGAYSINIDTGVVNLYTKPYQPYYNVVPVSKVISHNTYFNSDVVNFALQPIAGKKDLQASIVPLTPARVGMPATYRVLYKNVGTETVPSVKLTFVKNSKQTLVSTSPSPSSTNQDTVVWNMPGLKPLDTSSVILVLKLGTPPASNINDVITVSAMIDPVAGDLTPEDDTIHLKQIVVSSYDPNDKTELNDGSITAEQVAQGEWLSYLIRFQNTGTDTAFNITVTDTLDSKLDWTSLQMVEASNANVLDIKEGNKLTWTFNNIKLVDSNRNEPLSHGYIQYRIRPKTSLSVGDVIHNTAFIYFDFNSPVKTNEQLTTIRATPVPTPVLSGMQKTFCSNQGAQSIKILNYPAAGSNIAVKVWLDGGGVAVAADSTFLLDITALATGAHQLSVGYNNGTSAAAVVWDFNVTGAVTPDVNVTSNISTVSNLNDAVVVTAANAVGGGSNPLFTFAKDRAITNIIQGESVISTVTIQPGTLLVGTNWIYVKMKSSAACYTVQSNIDSVKIERATITGLTDVDFPNQEIKIYPNPFSRVINITGLNTAKGYTIIINDLKGVQVYGHQINNVNNYIVNKQSLLTGQYWLTIYDNSKKKLIGTMPLIKE
jgi:uncharacterized repeat protein (TIGR01451 family)